MSVDLMDEVVSHLKAAKSPVGYASLSKALVKKSKGVSEGDLHGAVAAAVNAGRAFHWGNYARSKQCYWHISRNQRLSEKIVELCLESAPKPSEVKVKGFSDAAEIAGAINELLKAGTLHKYPGIGQERARIGGSPQAYAAALHEFVKAKLAKAKVSPEVFYGVNASGRGLSRSPSEDVEGHPGAAEVSQPPQPAPPPMTQRILEAMPRLERPGLEVASVRLRRNLGIDATSKAEFDRAVLDLRDKKRVYLSKHHDPWGLTELDRMELIDGGDGSYYVSVTLLDQC